MIPPADPLARLRADLGLKRLNPVWAKLEIFLGLAVAGGGLFFGAAVARWTDASFELLLPSLALFVFGGYLALAGHRSHLYQSNNRLAAHLAELIRSHPRPPESHP